MSSCALEEFFKNGSLAWYLPNLMGFIVKWIKEMPRAWIQWNAPFAAALSNLDVSIELLCSGASRRLTFSRAAATESVN